MCYPVVLLLLFNTGALAQLGETKQKFTHGDTLRGSLNPNRTWWDVQRYDIRVKPDYATKTIEGTVRMKFTALASGRRMQIDLQQPLLIDGITLEATGPATPAKFEQQENVAIVDLDREVSKGETRVLSISYHGKPREAVRPPWDGGWIWKKDDKGRPWMSVACQGLGASVWYPCKDHQSDEPDQGATLTMIVPDTLMAVGNGRLIQSQKKDGLLINTWEVKNPINNYDIIPYIGKYTGFTDTFMGAKGKLDMGFWVLDYNLEKAREQFKQAKLMLRAFEYWMGPYPFYEDSYKLVDAPHLGMEHQSATAYGNRYLNGYTGRDLSGTGWGLKWDFIIVHESGHEWFGNSITSSDLADMWIHEGFTAYSETLFTDYYYGKEAGTDYNVGIRKNIRNDIPIIGPYGVNKEGSGDMYYKGSNMLHSIRHSINDDEKFRQILHGLSKAFYHQEVSTGQVERYISEKSGFDYGKIFDQYLRTTQIPELDFYKDSIAGTITCRWTHCVDGFDLPISLPSASQKIIPTGQWKTFAVPASALKNWNEGSITRLYYVTVKQLAAKP